MTSNRTEFNHQSSFASPTEALESVFGYQGFRACQSDIISHVTKKQHAMVVMPTGMGKSLCFQIPALMMPSDGMALTMVLSPLIALMQDQVSSLQGRGVDATFVNSSLDRQTREQRYRGIATGQYRLLYVTPERFRKPEFTDAIGSRDVHYLAVDEAHCVSQWGHDFRPDYSRLAEIRQRIGNPTTIAVTATATHECRQDIYRQLGIESDQIRLFHEGIDRPNLQLEVKEVWDEDEKLDAIVEVLKDSRFRSGSVIVYFSLIKTLQRFSDQLLNRGVDHVCYHGDLDRRRRRKIQDEFMGGRCDVVLATNAFGMGIDKPDIRVVIHAETPGSIESYYQEIGRAGRDEQPSLCLWLYQQSDLMTQMQFIEWSNPDAEFYNRLYTTLCERNEECRAFGLDWLNEQLQRRSKHDHRLATAIAMFDRHGVVAGPRPPDCFHVIGELGDSFQDQDFLGKKKRRDQQRLYAMVQLAGTDTEHRKSFLNDYFLGEDAGQSM